MSTLRISNIEAKSVPASATIDEKVKITNSSGDTLVFIDGKTSGITTVGINTTDSNITFDANSNVVVTGIITATRFSGQITPTSLEIGSNIKLGNAGVITATSFVGSGAQLTGITSPAITSIANDATNRVLTTDGDGTATAHSEVKIETVSGNKRLSINRGTGSTEVPLLVRRTDASGIVAEFSNSSGYGVYIGQNGATGEGYIRTATGQPLVFTTNAGSGIANERLRITSDGKMGLGITSPTGKFAVSDGTRIAEINPHSSGTFIGNRSNHDVLFQINAATKAKIDTNGHLTVTDGNLVMANGRGIDFSATANSTGSVGSELLKDYEEGTFTPYVRTNNNSTEPSYSHRVGLYTRVGRLVTYMIRITTSGELSTGSGATEIWGLPFNAMNWNVGDWPGHGEIAYYSNLRGNYGTNPRLLGPYNNANYIRFHLLNAQTDTGNNQYNHIFTNNTVMIISGQYFAG